MEKQEIWKDIEDYECHYQISNLGRFKSLKCGKERILKPHLNTTNYYQVALLLKGHIKVMLISRLVAIAFIPNPENKRTVNHKNGIRTDNRVENLEWNTYSENHLHAYRVLGRTCYSKTSDFKKIRKPVSKYSKDGELIESFVSQVDAAIKTGIKHQNISLARRGMIKTAGGFIWKLANQ